MSYNSFRNDNNGPGEFALIQFRKSNNFASVAALDLLGQVLWSGYDTVTNTYKSASHIYCQVTGAPAGNVPSELQFNTSFGTGTQLAMTIGENGQVTISNPNIDQATLFLNNNQTSPNLNLRTANATAVNSPHIHFTRSRAGTADVLAADDLGRLEFRGYQGGVAIEAATIRSQAETVNGASVSGNFQFLTRPTSYAALATRMNISADGAVSILNTVAGNIALTVNATATGGVEVQQNTAANAGMRIYTSLGNINGPRFEMLKSRSGGNVNANDNIGQFLAYGYQTGYKYAAQIVFKAESVAASRVSGAISFWTNSTAGANAVRLNISADGAVTIPATVAGNVPLTITGTTVGGLDISQANSGVISVSLTQSSATDRPNIINFVKNRAGGNINASDVISQMQFQGFATAVQNAALFRCYAESIGAARVSGAFDWWTTSAAGTLAQRLNLTANGALVINTPAAALTALTVNGFATAGTYAQQNNAYVTSGLFSAFRALNVDGTAGGSCQIEVSVFGQLAATGGDATLLFGNYGGTNIKIGNDVSVNQFSMSTGNLGDGNTFLTYDVATTQINKPRQCSFMARKSATTLNVTGNNTVTIVFDTESFDVSNSYNNTTGIFTAPKTGKYFFYATVRIENLTALMTAAQISIAATGQSLFSNFTNLAISRTITPNDINTMQISGIISMTTADTAQVQVAVLNGAGNTASIFGGAAGFTSTYFSGQLLS
jgi:hypothetical protein